MDTITAWLSALGLSQYAEVFQRNDIGPDLLESLTDQDLRDLTPVSGLRSCDLALARISIKNRKIANPTPSVPQLVHRRLRHEGPEGSEGIARAVGATTVIATRQPRATLCTLAWERQEHEAVTESLSLPAVSRFAHDRRERSPANPQPDRPRDGREAGS